MGMVTAAEGNGPRFWLTRIVCGETIESNSNNDALSRQSRRIGVRPDGEIRIDMHAVCRAAGLEESDVRDCLRIWSVKAA
jgi:hypothetical protein